MEALGIAAIILGLAGFIWKNPRHVMKLNGAASATWVTYFMSLSQFGAAATTTFAAIRFLAGAYASEKVMKSIVVGGTLITVPIALWLSPDLAGILVSTATILKGLCVYMRDHPMTFRILFAVSEACYIVFGLQAEAWSTVFYAVASVFVSIGSGLYFLWCEKRSDGGANG